VTGTLLYEIRVAGASDWTTIGSLGPVDREGSITDMTGGRRDVLLFRCEGGRSVISRSAAGIDFESGPDRVVLPLDGRRQTLAVLGDGQAYERDVISDAGREYRARWTHRAAP
jgi:hypothetical protein